MGFFKNLFCKGKSEEIYVDYQNILDSKLIPLVFCQGWIDGLQMSFCG